MKVVEGFPGALGFDTITPITTSERASSLHTWGMRFAIRYLGSLSRPELDVLLVAGLAVMPVTYSRKPGWRPSRSLGQSDGEETVRHLMALALPKGVTVWRDLEGPQGNAQDVIDWVDAWANVVQGNGYEAGLYVGYGAQLTSDDLWGLRVTRYWHSMSRVTDSAGQLAEPRCGWCMYQLYPSIAVAGVVVDANAIQKDYRNRLPHWVSR